METYEILFLLVGVILIMRLVMIFAISGSSNVNRKQAILWSSIGIVLLVLFKIGVIIG